MPQMANITVKNAANVDVVYTALTPSSGDTTSAQWRNMTNSTPLNAPHLTTRTHLNAARNGRVVTINAVFPHVVDIDGVSTPLARQPFQLTTTVPLFLWQPPRTTRRCGQTLSHPRFCKP